MFSAESAKTQRDVNAMHNDENAPCTSSCATTCASPNTEKTRTSGLRRFRGISNAAVGGLIEFGAKYRRSFDNTYDEFEDHRFFDSRDYRCCCSIFHAKIGTFIFCTLILHEIVLGTIYLLTQLEFTEMSEASRLVALLVCRFLQFPPMSLLYVALWRHHRCLLLPFAISQLTIGAFADISTFIILLEQLERANAPFLFAGDLRWLNVTVPVLAYMLIALALIFVLYRCFIFLHARRCHDIQRKINKLRERDTLLLSATNAANASPNELYLGNLDNGESENDEKDDLDIEGGRMLPDEMDIIGMTEKPNPRSINGEDTSISSEALPRRPFASHSTRHLLSQNNRHGSCQLGTNCHRGVGVDASRVNIALSALVLNKIHGDDSSGGVHSFTIPPRPETNNQTLKSRKFNVMTTAEEAISQPTTRKRLVSELARRTADAEYTALMLQHRNPRSSHLRGFRGSAYSLQDYFRFQMNVDKANSVVPTMGHNAESGDSQRVTRPTSMASNATDNNLSRSLSHTSSIQSLTLVKPVSVLISVTSSNMPSVNIESPMDRLEVNSEVIHSRNLSDAASTGSGIQFTVSPVTLEDLGDITPTSSSIANFSNNPFTKEVQDQSEKMAKHDEFETKEVNKSLDQKVF